MQRSILTLACALALSGAAIAQQDTTGRPPGKDTAQAPGSTFLERVKNAFSSLGEKAKPMAEKAKDKAVELKDKAADKTDAAASKDGDTRSMGAPGSDQKQK